ncbi:type II toxin-antitoxin system VapC family toxin [Dermabacter vaginalis]|uniref:type II toxin-antitoxin system VapC family toxin n=1 Tax=Dermabacter vaginalis TaxID=1630135 RepID=UPI001EE933CC|nr:type II toxin-antitoxin system VapC family toxin [Dermabacter vaginalis]
MAKLLLGEPDSSALSSWLDASQTELVSSDLLETELRRIAVREGVEQKVATAILAGVSLATLDRTAFRSAGLLPGKHLRTLDALHLESALRLGAAAMLTYDHRLAEACESVGLETIAPS